MRLIFIQEISDLKEKVLNKNNVLLKPIYLFDIIGFFIFFKIIEIVSFLS